MSIDVHILMSSGRVFMSNSFHWERDDSPTKEWWMETTQSLVDDGSSKSYRDCRTNAQNHEVWKAPYHLTFYKPYINSRKSKVVKAQEIVFHQNPTSGDIG